MTTTKTRTSKIQRTWVIWLGEGCNALAPLQRLLLTAAATDQPPRKGDEHDRYGRLLGVCSVGGVEKYSRTYVPEEQEARRAKRGVFAIENLPARLSFWDGFRVVSGHHAS